MRVIDFFDRGADMHPDRLFLKSEGATRTYRQTQLTSHIIAQAIHASGASAEAKIGIYSSNDVAAFECAIGVIRSGRPWVPINPRNSIDENSYILKTFDVEGLFYHSEHESQVERLRAVCPGLRFVVCIDREGADAPSLTHWLAPHDGPAPEVLEDPDATVLLFSSGGTTGHPKGTMWTHRVFATMTASFFLSMPVKNPQVHLVAAPLTHAAGILALMLCSVGATNVILKQADPLKIMETIARERVTRLFLPPTVIYMMLAHPCVRDFDYSSIEHFIYAAAPMSVEKLQEAIEVFGPVMTQVYGQAEAPIMLTYLGPEDHEVTHPQKARRLQSCGRPTLLTSVEIMNDEGRLLGEEDVGEIVVRGDLVMKGYYNNPEATAAVSSFGWHRTGDLGFKDSDGFVYIVDRKKDMIISGGFNVYPGEIEQVIWSHPAVRDCAVIGVPDEKWGEAVKAVVELKPGQLVTEHEIIALCKLRLGSVKSPKSVDFCDALPRTPVGKVQKKELRANYWRGRSRAI